MSGPAPPGRCTVRLSIASSCLFNVVWGTFTGICSADEEDRNACVHGIPPMHIRRVVHIHRDNITFSFICIDIEKHSGNSWSVDNLWALRGRIHLLTYLLTCSMGRVLLGKLTGSQLVKKFPAFYGTQRFIIAFYKCPPPVPILSQIDPVYAPQPIS
jgi:hypothetical protein